MQKWMKAGMAALLCLGCVAGAMAVEIPQNEWEAIKQRMATLEANQSMPVTSAAVDSAMDSKYGPDAKVTTKTGALRISLLTQIWYYDIGRDSRGLFSDPNTNAIVDNNNANDINSFRIRRTELKFIYDFSECFGATLMIDPTRETGGYPQFPSNQGNYKRTATGNGGFGNGTTTGNATIAGGFGGGTGSPPRLMQDAFLSCKGVVPYVDFKVGQFKSRCGEEGVRDSALLDFCERSMIGFQGDNRDMGANAHGSFWGKDCNDQDGRFQVWAGVFDGAGTYYNPGNEQNRSDNNQSKDFNAAFLVRPVWSDCFGKLELGASYFGGKHGADVTDQSSYPAITATTPIPNQTYASKGNVWFSYKCGEAFAKGLWVRGEYGFIRDRQEGSDIAFGNGNLGAGAAAGFSQSALEPFTSQGGYAAVGYKFGETNWLECTPCWLKGFEILGRYDQFQNIQMTNLGNPDRTSVYSTKVITAGINYYISDRVKIQANGNFVQLPAGGITNATRVLHDTQNDSFVINFQVGF